MDQGAIAEWDLAKIVVQHYQLPFLSVKETEPTKEAVACLPEDFLFENRVVPIELFGDALTLTMPILIPYKVLEQAGHLAKKKVFPLVGLFSENLETLFELFPEHDREIEEIRKKKLLHQDSGGSEWENIFDMGDQEVLKGLGD